MVDGKTLCITPFGVDVAGISETVALVGAIGAGLTSNARKAEIAELNEKLRAVNQTLRAQIRNVRAPRRRERRPPGRRGLRRSARVALDSMDLDEEAARSAHAEAVAAGADGAVAQFPEESESVATMKSALREGRALLKEETPRRRSSRRGRKFEKALMLSRMVGDQVQVRRAVRGLSASERGLGRGKEAIAHLKRFGNLQADGRLRGGRGRAAPSPTSTPNPADLENASKYYDLYLDALNDELNV